ncbi:MAG: hypothetical protein MZW92_31985 [Comamonadaceae bacterium]|nr:hypothetical protein [Comamonadaceae bacterium]
MPVGNRQNGKGDHHEEEHAYFRSAVAGRVGVCRCGRFGYLRVFAGQYASGNVDSCSGNCDADDDKASGDAMLGVGIQYGYIAGEVNGYLAGQGFGALLIGRLPVGDRHSVGLGGGIARHSVDVDLSPTISRSADGNIAVAFLEYAGSVYNTNRADIRLLVRAGWQDGSLKASATELAGTPPLPVASYHADIDQSGPFGQIGFTFRAK